MNLTTSVSTANSLIKFVTGEQMHDALTAIGDNHFRTAERVLRNLPKAHDQAALLRIGISHLEGAHTAYQKQWSPLKQWFPVEGAHTAYQKQWSPLAQEEEGTTFQGMRAGIAINLRPFSFLMACKKDIYTCCLLAACYAYLKEEELVHLAIEHAEAAQHVYAKWQFLWSKDMFDLVMDNTYWFVVPITNIPAFFQLKKVPEVSLPDYKNNLLSILPELCNR